MTEVADVPKKILPNFVANLAFFAVNLLVGLLMVPYYIDTLGISAYGIIPLATSISSYIALISDSMSAAIGRYVAIASQKEDGGGYVRTYSTALFGLAKVILAIMPAAVLVGLMSPFLFNTGSESWLGVQILFVGIMVSVLITAWSNCFMSVLFGRHRLDLYNAVKVINISSQVGLVVLCFMSAGPSLALVGISYAGASVIALASSALMVKRIQPNLKAERSSYDSCHFKEICNLGAWSMVNSLGLILFIQTSMIVCNLMLGTDKAGVFAIAVNIMLAVSAVSNTICIIFTPIIYHFFAKNEIETMGKVCKTAVKICGILMAFPMAFVCIFSPEILQTWLGTEDYAGLAATLMIFFTTLVATDAIAPVYPVFMANLKVRVPGIVTFILGILNVVFAVIAVKLGLGINGIAIAWVVTMTLKNMVFNPLYYSRIMKEHPWKMYSKLLPGLLLFYATVAIGLKLNIHIPATWVSLIAVFLLGTAAYFVVSMPLLLNKEEKIMVLSALPERVAKFFSKTFRIG